MQDYEVHDLATIFPEMDAAEFGELVEDIRKHGQREQVTLYEGRILDGRHRHAACKRLGRETEVWDWEGTWEEARDYVVSLNMHRRQLTPAQRAVAADGVPAGLRGEAEPGR